ncbi:MAG TPA: endonuclease/exonuclease/phosphatase family protein [Acetobacteraceae bacterium]|nr:endonuclease/exonuclease/phosphatase family protein [Acetobacteraceae bacterium]
MPRHGLRSGRLASVALVLVMAVCLPPVTALAAELKIATWNLDWLTDRPANDPALPSDVHVRGAGDFDRLRYYAAQLNADVIAIQEVDGSAVAARLFPASQYSIHMTHDDVVQRVGIVVRRGLAYAVNPDVTALDVDPRSHLRSGADITLHLGGESLRILALHLKTGCHDASLTKHTRRSCAELRAQIRPLQEWIGARRREGVPFLVLGDFNRHMDGKDQLWSALRRVAPLVRATEGHTSPCWGGESFIDHIIAGGQARDWMQVSTLKVLTYLESGEVWKDRLSDHCPVSIILQVAE